MVIENFYTIYHRIRADEARAKGFGEEGRMAVRRVRTVTLQALVRIHTCSLENKNEIKISEWRFYFSFGAAEARWSVQWVVVVEKIRAVSPLRRHRRACIVCQRLNEIRYNHMKFKANFFDAWGTERDE